MEEEQPLEGVVGSGQQGPTSRLRSWALALVVASLARQALVRQQQTVPRQRVQQQQGGKRQRQRWRQSLVPWVLVSLVFVPTVPPLHELAMPDTSRATRLP